MTTVQDIRDRTIEMHTELLRMIEAMSPVERIKSAGYLVEYTGRTMSAYFAAIRSDAVAEARAAGSTPLDIYSATGMSVQRQNKILQGRSKETSNV